MKTNINHSYTLISYFQNSENSSKKSTRFWKKKIRNSNRKLVRTYELETLRFEVDQLDGFSLVFKNRQPGSSTALFFTREVKHGYF